VQNYYKEQEELTQGQRFLRTPWNPCLPDQPAPAAAGGERTSKDSARLDSPRMGLNMALDCV